jgi:hypothetical protein
MWGGRIAAIVTCWALLVGFVISPANATTYGVDEVGLPFQCSTYPACTLGSLTGTITTNGTFGTGLSPSIITGWNLILNDGTNPSVNLTTANSFITFNFTNLLSATPAELAFNFSPTPCCIQQDLEFTSTSNGAAVVTIFAALSNGDLGGIGIDAGYSGFENVTYLSGTQPIAFGPNAIGGETPVPAALPLFATGLGAMGLFGWRRKRKASDIVVGT